MATSINSNSMATVHSGGIRGGNDKALESGAESTNSLGSADDSATISGAAKGLNQPPEMANLNIDSGQARQLVADINALFAQDATQALLSQSVNIDESVKELLQQTA